MRVFNVVAAVIFALLGGAASAQVSVPNTFTAGTPARAADVNANFQALVTAVNTLSSRVSKLEGQITSADLVGTYAVNQFQSELGGGASGRVAVYTGGGTVTFAAGGTGTVSGNTELGHQLNLPGGTLTAINRPQADFSINWSFSNGTVTVTFTQGSNTFSVVAGGRLLIATSTNPADGTNVILLLTRIN
jgi:hypothetical protein